MEENKILREVSAYSYLRTEFFYNDMGDLDKDGKLDVFIGSQERYYIDCQKFLDYLSRRPLQEQDEIRNFRGAWGTMHRIYQTCSHNPSIHLRDKTHDESLRLIDFHLSSGIKFDRKKTPLKVEDGIFDPTKTNLLYEKVELNFGNWSVISWQQVRFKEWAVGFDKQNNIILGARAEVTPTSKDPIVLAVSSIPQFIPLSNLYLNPKPSLRIRHVEEKGQ